MTIFYPDISSFQAGVSISGAPAVCIKATEGTGYANPDYGPALGRARSAGAFAFAYHFLHAGNAGGQAAWCRQHVGQVPLMLDFEPTPVSRPSLGDALTFLDAFRSDGGICHLCYFPHWYWQQLGSPGLGGLASRGQHLVSSSYSSYTDDAHGPGWLPYGGMTPAIWQYTDSHNLNGVSCDYNAFKGTITQLRVLAGATGGGGGGGGGTKAPAFPYKPTEYLGQPSSDPHHHDGYKGGPDHINVHDWQHQMATRGWVIAQDGCFGPASDKVARLFQAEKGLSVDGKVGPQTWAETWTAPVTA
jgi:hypothetical protein